jgi:neutral ceramidase
MRLANGYNGYLPPPRHHELGGYETWPGRGSYLEVDAEPKIRAALLGLLRKVSEAGQPVESTNSADVNIP